MEMVIIKGRSTLGIPYTFSSSINPKIFLCFPCLMLANASPLEDNERGLVRSNGSSLAISKGSIRMQLNLEVSGIVFIWCDCQLCGYLE